MYDCILPHVKMRIAWRYYKGYHFRLPSFTCLSLNFFIAIFSSIHLHQPAHPPPAIYSMVFLVNEKNRGGEVRVQNAFNKKIKEKKKKITWRKIVLCFSCCFLSLFFFHLSFDSHLIQSMFEYVNCKIHDWM